LYKFIIRGHNIMRSSSEHAWWLVKSSRIIYSRGLYGDVPMVTTYITLFYSIYWVKGFRRVANQKRIYRNEVQVWMFLFFTFDFELENVVLSMIFSYEQYNLHIRYCTYYYIHICLYYILLLFIMYYVLWANILV